MSELNETGSLCDCQVVDFVQSVDELHPVKQGDEFDFGTALHLMELGERVQREGNGELIVIYKTPPSDYRDLDGNKFEHSEYLALETTDNEVVPWVISQTAVLAKNWMLAS